MYKAREKESIDTLSDSDGISIVPESSCDDLFDLDIDDNNFLMQNYSQECFKLPESLDDKMRKLKVVKLDSVSISPSLARPQHIVNLQQSFNFSNPMKPSKVISTQTSKMDLIGNPAIKENHEERRLIRPTSLPPENIALVHLEKRVKADVIPKICAQMAIGDGDKNILNEKIESTICELRKPDLEIADFIPVTPVQCVMIKPKSSRLQTPKFHCKKFNRPQTKHPKKRPDPLRSLISSSDEPIGPKIVEKKNVKEQAAKFLRKSVKLSLVDEKSDLSIVKGIDLGGNHHDKLLSVIDKLQDHEWEICLEGLKTFLHLAAGIDWDSELGLKFIPIISRKLIEFFRSPRSNLCRTACQTAGEFFVMAKSTKRPEFDEMIDILMCKTADPNRFIQKDAGVALDKMATSICIQHSVRAICAKCPDHKNPVVRASTARILLNICKSAGVDHIVGSDANPRTRKRVLTTLAKFLMDKNLETRRHAESLCKLLKRHKFFVEYFFKDIDNNYKNALRKILNSLDAK